MALNKQNENILFKVALFGAAYFLFAKPILNFLGITKGKGRQLADQYGSAVLSAFNPALYQKYYYWYNEKANNRKLITVDMTTRITKSAQNLWAAMGYFTDNEDQAFAAFKNLRSQCEVSILAGLLLSAKGKDLLQFLQKGQDILPENGLSDSEIEQIITYVSRLPLK